MLTAEKIKEFQAIIEADYGVQLSEAEATVTAQRLILLYELLSSPTPTEAAAVGQGAMKSKRCNCSPPAAR